MKFVFGDPPVGNYKVFDDDGTDVTQYFRNCRSVDIEIRPDDLNVIKIELTGEVEVDAAPENVKAILGSFHVEENGLRETTTIGDEYKSWEQPK